MDLKHELKAVFFMWKREMIRFFNSKSRVVASLGMPFFFLVILGTGLSGAFAVRGHTTYLQFMTPGILSMVILFGSFFSGIQIIIDRQFGFLKETLVAPVSRTSIVIGKALGGATSAMITGLLMLFIASFLGVQINIWAVPLLALLMAILSVSIVSIGMAFGSAMEDMQGFPVISNLVIMPLFFLSGALFPLDSAPEILRTISYLDPLTYAVEAMRFVLTGNAQIGFALSLGVLLAFTFASIVIAAYLFSRIEE